MYKQESAIMGFSLFFLEVTYCVTKKLNNIYIEDIALIDIYIYIYVNDKIFLGNFRQSNYAQAYQFHA